VKVALLRVDKTIPFPLNRTFFNISWRYLRGHLWQSALMVIGIMLGVAIIIGVDIANESASQAFNLSTAALTGRATHYISGGSQGLDEKVYFDLRRNGIPFPAAPVMIAYTSSPDLGGETLQVLGVDPFVEAPFRNYIIGQQGVPVGELTDFLVRPNSVLISKDKAEQHNLGLGSKIMIGYAGNSYPFTIVGLMQTEDALSRRALNEILLMDIATAQELTGKFGVLNRVDLILPEDAAISINELQDHLPVGVQVLPVESRDGVVKEMTQAFRVNLTALSVLAMVVALFLIYNTITFSVAKRRSLFGILRSLGVTKREVFLMVIMEVLVIGVAGAVLGTILGILMGRGTVGLVTQTINDLFFVTTVRDIPIPLISLIKGNLLGVLATVVTAAFPAWEAVNIPPLSAISRSDFESKTRKVIPWIGLIGVFIILIGTAFFSIPSNSLIYSFAGAFAIVIGLAMLTPLVTIWLMSVSTLITRKVWGAIGRIAPREVVNSISRTSIAVAALMVAIAVTIGVSIMVNSFRHTVITWLDQILRGDIYISVPSANASQLDYPIDPEAISLLENWEGIERVDLLQTAVVGSPYGSIQISANNNPYNDLGLIYMSSDIPPDMIWNEVQQGAILISEPLANRLELPLRGAELALYTNQGLHTFPVVGIYFDYSSTQGTAILSLDVYQQYWQDENITAAALVLPPGSDLESVTQDLKTGLAGVQNLLIRPNQALRAEILEIFDRTFAITTALQVMTIFVAFVGVLSAMMALQLDKQRQLGILRAIGITGKQLWTLVILETGLMGLVAGLFAMPTGYILSLILIYIINRRSFGWTLQMQVELEPFIQAVVIAVGASFLAGFYPARRILQRNTSEAIRFE
jgi:putative ABC transport system permease protein